MKQKRLFFLISLLSILIVIRMINPLGLPKEELTKLAIDAVEDGNIKKVRSLIAKGANFNTQDKNGETLLHIAVEWGEKDITKLLIGKGADVNIKNKHGITPLCLAIGRRKHIAELPETKNANGYLDRGIYFYQQNEFDRAIEDYTTAAQLNSEDDYVYYWRARAWAKKGNPRQAINDWKKAIQINWRNALHTYYARSLLESTDAELDQLIKNKAKEHLEDLEAVTGYAVGYGGTPGNFYTASLIISKPFEEEYFLQMVHNDNPVVRAMSLICLAREDISRYEKIIRHFYADTSEVDYNPLGCGVFRKSLGTIAKGIIEDPNLLDCWSPAHTDWKLITSKRNSNHIDETQQRPSIVKALIADGADVNAKDQYGETPLHYAAQNGSTHLAKLLIANSADVNAKNNSDETPLFCAILWGYKDISELLIINGADLDTKTIRGQTPLKIAKEMNYQGLYELLRKYGAQE